MRLLNTKTLKLEDVHQDVPGYAILSHRWGTEEVTLQDLSNDRAETKKGWSKVVRCCRMAASRNISWAWIDTCCIDKSSSAELSEAINSMYAWYEQATECYAFLSDVHGTLQVSNPTDLAKEMAGSVWFTRGWTLQELVAPTKLIFFNSRWERLWTKATHGQELQDITHISRRLLEGHASLSDYSLAQRMAWAANRTTTRPEDEAYCLLGVFQVNMSMVYGEGKKAFHRLQEEIIKQSDDQTLFAWHDDRDIKPVLAPSVSCFRDLYDLKCIYATNDSRFGHTLSNAGLRIKLMLIPWAMDIYVAPLSCGRSLDKLQSPGRRSTRGYRRMAIFLRRTKFEDHLVRVKYNDKDYVMLDSDIVAYKRDSFAIKDRRVFVRESLVDMADETYHSFAFNYHHPQMFPDGSFPNFGIDILNFLDRNITCFHGNQFSEPYSHYESVAFDITNLSKDRRPHYLHLGFDLKFAPLCLITTESWLVSNKNRVCEHDFEEMYSSRSKQVSSLSWLLSQVKAGKSLTSVLAFQAKPGASTEVNCKELSLKIRFEVKNTAYEFYGLGRPAKIWHVTFEYFESTPSAVSTPCVDQFPLQLPTRDTVVDERPISRAKRASPWLKFLIFKKTKSQQATVHVDELLASSSHNIHRRISEETQSSHISDSRSSQMWTVSPVPKSPAHTRYDPSPSIWDAPLSSTSPSPPTTTPYTRMMSCHPQSMMLEVPLKNSYTANRTIPSPVPLPIRAAPTLFEMPFVNVPPGPGSNLITAGWYLMGSDQLRRVLVTDDRAESLVIYGSDKIYELDGNNSIPTSPPDLRTNADIPTSLTSSETTQTAGSSKVGTAWTAQKMEDLRKLYEGPLPTATARLRVKKKMDDLRKSC